MSLETQRVMLMRASCVYNSLAAFEDRIEEGDEVDTN
jgi:hypothetical protein